MARGTGGFDPFAYDFARNEAEVGTGFTLYRTNVGLGGGLQVNADYTPSFFGQTVSPILSSDSPWPWILILVAFFGVLTLFKKQ